VGVDFWAEVTKSYAELVVERLPMFRSRPRKLVIALVLAVLATGTGVAPVIGGTCRSSSAACRCRCGCCTSRTASKSSCCRTAKPISGSCVCGRQGESPAVPTPPNDRRGSDDPLAAPQPLSHMAAMPGLTGLVATGRSQPDNSSPSPPRLQAVLCRWLT
jgi:hypothetical protein